jgi:RNA polymerase sigma-70 factor (ECF subfamily)
LAIQELYTYYGAAVQRYCYARLGTLEAAQECTQDVFVRVWKHVPSFEYRGEPSFISWLYTIAHRLVIRDVRKRQHTPSLALTPDLDGLIDQRSDLADTICNRLALVEALDQLTGMHHQVLILKFFGGFSNLEIAAALGRSEGAIKALQHRALARLQQLLTAEPTAPSPPSTRIRSRSCCH